MKLLLDANLALLLVVGLTDQNFIREHKRLSGYNLQDFDALTDYIGGFDEIIFLPNILTEVSNLAVYGLSAASKSAITKTLGRLIVETEEFYVESRAGRSEFDFLRLTDAALLEACARGSSLLTDDGALFAAACSSRLPVQTFAYLRSQR